MLKKILFIFLFALVWSVGVQAKDLKIGFVNIQMVMDKSPQGEEAAKTIEKEFSNRGKRLEADAKELKRLEEKFARDAAIMSDSEKERTQKEIFSKRRDFRRSKDEFQEDLNFRRNEVLSKMQKQVLEAIESLAREEDYDLLLTSGVVHASDSIDVTQKILEKLRRGYRGR